MTNGLKCKHCGKIIPYESEEFKTFLNDVQKAVEKVATLQKEKQEHPNDENLEDKISEIQEETPTLRCPGCDGTDFLEMIKFIMDPQTKKYSLLIDGHSIMGKDYNLLRQIVLFQNFYDYADDSWVDPEVKKDHDEKMRLERQKNDIHASIEKKVVCLSVTTNYKFEEIYNMSIRKFTMALATVDDLINYKIMRQAVMSGFVSLPKGQTIEHWIYKPNKDMYGDSYKSVEQLSNEVSHL